MTVPPLPAGAKALPKALTPPFDVSTWKNEKHVKRKIKALLDHYGWFSFMPAANGFGVIGIHDHIAIKDGPVVTVEAKFGSNKPTPAQKAFAGHMIANQAFSFCVNEKNIDHFAYWLDSFQQLVQSNRQGQPPDDAHGARCMNAQFVLTRGWE